MKRRRYTLYNRINGIPLIAPEEMINNGPQFLKENGIPHIVNEFDWAVNNITVLGKNNELIVYVKKYSYSVHNNIPKYWNNSGDYKKDDEHFLPPINGAAIVSETLTDGTVLLSDTYTLLEDTRVSHQFKTGSTYRFVIIYGINLEDPLNKGKADTVAYCPMDTQWFFLGNCSKLERPEYYSAYTVDGSTPSHMRNYTYNTINYFYVRLDISLIPDYFAYFCNELDGGFICPDTVKTIGKYAFGESSIQYVIFQKTNSIESVGTYAFYSYYKNALSKTWTLNFPDTLISIGSQGFGGNNNVNYTYTIKELRIPPKLKFNPYALFYSNCFKCEKLTISGIDYKNTVPDNNNGWYQLFNGNLTSINIDGIEYDDLNEDGTQPQGTIPYGVLVDNINGHKNGYYIGNDRGLHYKDDKDDTLIVKPISLSDTEYSLLIDEGTTILECKSFPNNFKGNSNLLILPTSLKKIKSDSLNLLKNFVLKDPFNPETNGGKVYDNLTELVINNELVNPNDNGEFYIPDNVSKLSVNIGIGINKNGIPTYITDNDGKIIGIDPRHNTKFIVSTSNNNFLEYDGCLYSKTPELFRSKYRNYPLFSIPKSWLGEKINDNYEYDGVLHIYENCELINNIVHYIYGIKQIIVNRPDDNPDLPMCFYNCFRFLYNMEHIDLPNVLESENWSLSLGKPDIDIYIPNLLLSDVPFYYNYFGWYHNKEYKDINGDIIDSTTLKRFAENGMLMKILNNKKYVICVPGYYRGTNYLGCEYNNVIKLLDIMEGINYFDSISRVDPNGNNYALLNSKQDYIFILPSTIEKIGSIGYSNSNKYPEIHIHKTSSIELWPFTDSINGGQVPTYTTQLTVAKNRSRICRVPINALGWDCDSTQQDNIDSFIWKDCWCNPLCLSGKLFSELRFDLRKLEGQISGNIPTHIYLSQNDNDEILTVSNTDCATNYNYDMLKNIVVPVKEDGTFEVWIKNVNYNIYSGVSAEGDIKDTIEKIGGLTSITITNERGECTDIITTNFPSDVNVNENTHIINKLMTF